MIISSTLPCLNLTLAKSRSEVANNVAESNSETSATQSKFFSMVSISSENMRYNGENLANDDYTNELLPYLGTPQPYLGALYTNTNLTVSTDAEKDVTLDNIKVIGTYSFNTTSGIYDFSNISQSQSIQEKYIKTITTASDTYKVITINLTYPEIFRLAFTLSYTVTKYNSEGQSYTATETAIYHMNIIQIAENFNTLSPVTYSCQQKNSISMDTLPSIHTGETYRKVDMKLNINGTPINPLYVHFIKNGESYILYNIDGKFYNDISRTAEETTRMVQEPITELTDNTIQFDKSGIYELEVYDRASTFTSSNSELEQRNPNANYKSNSFFLETNETQAYITAQDQSGTQIASGQPTNDNVTLKLYNLSTAYIKQINIDEYNTSTSTSVQSVYSVAKWNESYAENGMLLDKDRIYTIRIIYVEAYKQNNVDYVIQIIKDIRATYIDQTDTRYTATGENVVQNITIKQPVEINYGHGIKTEYVHTYTVSLANSNPSIRGIANNGSIKGTVNLSVYGVGKITVKIYKNNSLVGNPVSYESGESFPIKNSGKYKVEITDSTNTTAAINFRIKKNMNLATILLIVVGAGIVALIVFFIIRNRSKMSVR